jgi:hypothetical protein
MVAPVWRTRRRAAQAPSKSFTPGIALSLESPRQAFAEAYARFVSLRAAGPSLRS